jgi:hypothetical protein
MVLKNVVNEKEAEQGVHIAWVLLDVSPWLAAPADLYYYCLSWH